MAFCGFGPIQVGFANISAPRHVCNVPGFVITLLNVGSQRILTPNSAPIDSSMVCAVVYTRDTIETTAERNIWDPWAKIPTNWVQVPPNGVQHPSLVPATMPAY